MYSEKLFQPEKKKPYWKGNNVEEIHSSSNKHTSKVGILQSLGKTSIPLRIRDASIFPDKWIPFLVYYFEKSYNLVSRWQCSHIII